MRYLYQSIIGFVFYSSSFAYAFDFYADLLYWQPSETVDWALTNSDISASIPYYQSISYKTIAFNYAPGFRVGAGFERDDWRSRLFYTRYKTEEKSSTNGNVISTFMPSKFSSKFYQSGHVNFTIDFNMFDLELSKPIMVEDAFEFSPLIGLRGGWINQEVNTLYQNPISVPPASFNPNDVFEHVSNNFSGLGPKIGIGSQWYFYRKNKFQTSLVGDISLSYLWGKWSIHDTLFQKNRAIIGFVNVGKRDFGALGFQGLLGIHFDYMNSSLKIGYEVSDWFNQYQVFDNGSGTHTNDLVLLGLTAAFNYRF